MGSPSQNDRDQVAEHPRAPSVPLMLVFPPYRIDLSTEQLWRGSQPIGLSPKAWQLLRYLAERPGELVTKQTLMDEIWPDTWVEENNLSGLIHFLRATLADDARSPRYIRTEHRRGFRFVADVEVVSSETDSTPADASATPIVSAEPTIAPTSPGSSSAVRSKVSPIVGRDAELRTLEQQLSSADDGHQQLVFITGEPGIGKTTLVDSFLRQAGRRRDGEPVWSARGQCVEQHGGGEAYMPVLHALGRLADGEFRELVVATLRRYSPSWLLQLPWLLSDSEAKDLRASLAGTTPERMLRELPGALEKLTCETTLVLVLEDLHWSDHATIDLLGRLAHESSSARLLVVATVRPGDALVSGHPVEPLRKGLVARQLSTEIRLDLLDAQAVEDYVSFRFDLGDRLHPLAARLHASTEGNPLFMVSFLEYCVTKGWVAQREGRWHLDVDPDAIDLGVPRSLEDVIELQIGQLDSLDSSLLETASVAGAEFDTQALAAASGLSPETVEARCAKLAERQQFVRTTDEVTWPDGTAGIRCRFRHVLYHRALYENVRPARRRRLHQEIGEQTESGFADQTSEVAAELAAHFERSGDLAREVKYLAMAAVGARQRFVVREAVHYLRAALERLEKLPATIDNKDLELRLRVHLAMALTWTEGRAADDVARNLTRAEQLCTALGDRSRLGQLLFGLWQHHLEGARLDAASSLLERLLDNVRGTTDPRLKADAQCAAGTTAFCESRYELARELLAEPDREVDRAKQRAHTFFYTQDTVAWVPTYRAWTWWCLGYSDRASTDMEHALRVAEQQASAVTLAGVLTCASLLAVWQRRADTVSVLADQLLRIGREQGLPAYVAQADLHRAWLLVQGGDAARGETMMRESLAVWKERGSQLRYPCALSLLAEAQLAAEKLEQGLATVEEAIALSDRTRDYLHRPELSRIKGQLLLREARAIDTGLSRENGAQGESSAAPAAQACFEEAIELARSRSTKILELRASVDLARLWQTQGRTDDARGVLEPVYGWFTEGLGTPDLEDAAFLLAEVS